MYVCIYIYIHIGYMLFNNNDNNNNYMYIYIYICISTAFVWRLDYHFTNQHLKTNTLMCIILPEG